MAAGARAREPVPCSCPADLFFSPTAPNPPPAPASLPTFPRFCGADSLYPDLPAQLAAARVLVFTAGLLLHLLKGKVYRLESASLLILQDAFSGGWGP